MHYRWVSLPITEITLLFHLRIKHILHLRICVFFDSPQESGGLVSMFRGLGLGTVSQPPLKQEVPPLGMWKTNLKKMRSYV